MAKFIIESKSKVGGTHYYQGHGKSFDVKKDDAMVISTREQADGVKEILMSFWKELVVKGVMEINVVPLEGEDA